MEVHTTIKLEDLKTNEKRSSIVKNIEDRFNGNERPLNRKERREQDKLNRSYRTNVLDLLVQHTEKKAN